MKGRCIDSLKAYTSHEHARITNSGNGAIFAALYAAKKAGYEEVLAPDQGGWLTYLEYPAIIGAKLALLKTDRALVRPETLSMFRDAALILPSYGGYIVEQPLMEISKMCKKNNILLIEDASGSLSSKKLCNGRFSDIIVASFGKGKIVDNGCGGFISANDKAFLGSEVSSLTKPIGIDYSRLSSKIENAPHRLAMLRKEHDAVKRDLLQFPIIHSEREGINVAVSFKTEQEKMKIIKYCDGKGLSYTLCPRYIRIMEEAVSIEIKRMSGDDSNERA